jgi:hypothetical protein
LDTTCTNKITAEKPISVRLPNGHYITSSHTASLPFPKLPQKALEAHVFPGLNGQALLSIGTFCDAGCIATFTATDVIITLNGKVVLTGKREPPGLWKTEELQTGTSTATNPWQANGAYTTQLRSNAIKFMHAACFSPTTETWTKAIDAGACRHGDGQQIDGRQGDGQQIDGRHGNRREDFERRIVSALTGSSFPFFPSSPHGGKGSLVERFALRKEDEHVVMRFLRFHHAVLRFHHAVLLNRIQVDCRTCEKNNVRKTGDDDRRQTLRAVRELGLQAGRLPKRSRSKQRRRHLTHFVVI